MGNLNFNDDFKWDAVCQIAERGYPVTEVSQRLVSASTRFMPGRSRSLEGQQAGRLL